MKIKPSLHRRVLAEGIGPGGWECTCCAPAPGKDRKRMLKSSKKKFRRFLTRLIDEELKA